MKRTRGLFALAVFMTLVATASAGDNAMFNYQGRVMVQGVPYTGAGRMKAAILATTGSATISLWSNDGSSAAGSQPTGSFAVDVNQGVFDVMIGDAALGMQALPAILFNRDDELKVRVWFNDGLHGFQQLSPDRRLTNPRRLGLARVTEPTWIYVNSTTGNDWNSGLTTDTAKRTVQAAIDMLPRSIHASTKVKLAPGAYSRFTVNGFNDMPAGLEIQGDPTHNPMISESLSVTMVGSSPYSGVLISNSNNISVSGIACQGFYKGFEVTNCSSGVIINRCTASACSDSGFNLNTISSASFNKCYVSGCNLGFSYAFNCFGYLGASTAESNGTGLFVYWNSTLYLLDNVLLKSNTTGILSLYQCVMASGSRITYTGNGTNTDLRNGSGIY